MALALTVGEVPAPEVEELGAGEAGAEAEADSGPPAEGPDVRRCFFDVLRIRRYCLLDMYGEPPALVLPFSPDSCHTSIRLFTSLYSPCATRWRSSRIRSNTRPASRTMSGVGTPLSPVVVGGRISYAAGAPLVGDRSSW
jgi:hypothetical protein